MIEGQDKELSSIVLRASGTNATRAKSQRRTIRTATIQNKQCEKIILP